MARSIPTASRGERVAHTHTTDAPCALVGSRAPVSVHASPHTRSCAHTARSCNTAAEKTPALLAPPPRAGLPDEEWALHELSRMEVASGSGGGAAAADVVASWPQHVAAAAAWLSWPELLPVYVIYAARRARWVEAYVRKKARVLGDGGGDDAVPLGPVALLQPLPPNAAVPAALRVPASGVHGCAAPLLLLRLSRDVPDAACARPRALVGIKAQYFAEFSIIFQVK